MRIVLNLEGKTKDIDKARLDLKDMGIRPKLQLYKEGDRWYKPHAQFVLTVQVRKEVSNYIKSVHFPDGFAANLMKNVSNSDAKISRLKSRDCHIIMQRLLSPGNRMYLKKEEGETIIDLYKFFQLICARTLHADDLKAATEHIISILC